MTYDTLSIKSITDAANLTGQQNIDADIILPDYYDTIGKILKSEITTVTEAVNTSGDKISVAGIAKFSMIYYGEDKKLYCYENEYKYTKVFQSQYAENCPAVTVKQNVFSLNCRAIAPKRIELRAVLQIGVKLKSESNRILISDIDDDTVFTKNENFTFISTVNCVSRSFSVNGSYPMSEFNEPIGIIIRKESRFKVSETKTIHNKAYLKGIAETELFYYSVESGNTVSAVLTMPISEIIDIFGAEEDDSCNIRLDNINTEIIIKGNDSSNQSVDVRVDINILAEINRSVSANIVTDLYSVKKDVISVKDTVDVAVVCNKSSRTENIIFETDIYDDNSYTVSDCWVENIRINSEKTVGKYNLLVTASFNALLKDDNGNLSVISRENTFETELLSENGATNAANISSTVLSISALQVKGGKLRFSSDIFFEADIYTMCKVSGFTSVEIDEMSSIECGGKYIIYFGKKNEEIWSVAKENKTSVETIKLVNNLSGNVLNEDKMLLLPSF